MDIKDQLKQLFPNHTESPKEEIPKRQGLFMQEEPLICKFEKRVGKPYTIIEGYTGESTDFKELTKEIKTSLGVGGTFKDSIIIIQGDYRDRIMSFLKSKGFKVKRVGG